MKKIILLLIILQYVATAQVPNLLKDVTPGSASTTFGEFTTLSNTSILFFAKTSSIAPTTDLWVSDGSTAGTHILRTFNSASISVLYKDPYILTAFAEYNNKKYFVANNGSAGIALWRTDGTPGGTDSLPLPGLSKVDNITVVNNVMIILGEKSSYSDQELWRSDGTIPGTYPLSAFTNIYIYSYTLTSNTLFFQGATNATGTELYRTDGSVGGTFLIKDISPGAASSFLSTFIFSFNNYAFFIANDGSTGNELWKTDGTVGGASLLKDINPGSASGFVTLIKLANNGFYFLANDQAHGIELWFSDGTTTNTHLIKDIAPGTASAVPGPITLNGNDAYYFYNQRTIYKTNGTFSGIDSLNVSDFMGTSSLLAKHYINDDSLHLFNNELYFTMVRSDHNTQLWSDTLSFNKVDLNLNSRTVLSKIKHDSILGGQYLGYYNSSNYVLGSHFIYFIANSISNHDCNIMIFNPQTNQHRIYYATGVNYLNGYGIKPKHFPPLGNRFYIPYVPQDLEPAYLDLTNDSIYLLKNIDPAGTSLRCSSNSGDWNNQLYPLNNKYYF